MSSERKPASPSLRLTKDNMDVLSCAIARERAFMESLAISDELRDFDPRFNTKLIKKVLTAVHDRETKSEDIHCSVSSIVEILDSEDINKESPPLLRAVRFLQAAGRIRTNDYYNQVNFGKRDEAIEQLEHDWKTLELLRDIPGEIQGNFAPDYHTQRSCLRERTSLTPYDPLSFIRKR